MVKKKIHMKWAKSDDPCFYNFGDDLGPYIVQKLSGAEVKYIYFACSRMYAIKQIAYKLIKGKLSSFLIKEFLRNVFLKQYLITIGSILQYYSSKRAIVWGSGIISKSDKIYYSKFIAVRGKYTEEKVRALGFIGDLKLGDPALLLPLVLESGLSSQRKYTLGIIPHYIHFEEIKSKLLPKNVKVINLNNQNIEEVVDDICSCSYTISSSLHGIIVSHAYGIKSLWFNLSKTPLAGDNIKFLDYFSSVEIPEYEPFNTNHSDKFLMDDIIKIFEEHQNFCSPAVDLKKIQKDLLQCAPFHVDSKFFTKID